MIVTLISSIMFFGFLGLVGWLFAFPFVNLLFSGNGLVKENGNGQIDEDSEGLLEGTNHTEYNPTSGLPMASGSMVDVAGNMYGTNSSTDLFSTNDSFSSSDNFNENNF